MKKTTIMRNILFLCIFVASAINSFGQQPLKLQLQKRGEVVVTFDAEYLKQIPDVYSWSIDKVKDNKATVYLNEKHYNKLLELNIPFVLEPAPSLINEVKMATSIAEMKQWDAYPNYNTYLAMMLKFTTDFPELCMLDTIGYSTDGRLLLALKISDNVAEDESEPEFFYTSSMHGDELTGYVLMLRLADYLLNNYENPKIKNLVDNIEIYINPLANPDGTFAEGNNTVNGATRGNANDVNINRNFPDPKRGEHPDGEEWQTETLAMMDYMKNRSFSMSMNFHGGAEVINYPWDTFVERHVDTDWFTFISRAYADTVHDVDPNYMTDLENGITNGFDWYEVAGGRQDYVTYYLHGREITAEISEVKLPEASELPAFWDKNYRSLLNYMEQSLYGIHGSVTDIEGNPLQAKITVLNHDDDSSHVRTQKSGVFYRYLKDGTYDIKIQADGYISQTISVVVNDFETTPLVVEMEVGTSIASTNSVDFSIYPNPTNDKVNVKIPKSTYGELQLKSLDGKVLFTNNVSGSENLILNLSNIPTGLYFVIIRTERGSKAEKLLVY